jgi:hypothetical protein
MLAMRSILIVFLLQVCGLAVAAEKESAPDFPGTNYPPIVGFFNCIELHTNAVRNLQQTNCLVVTEFYRMDRLGGDMLRYIQKENGQMTNGVDDGSGTLEDPQHKQLSKVEMERVHSILNRLPGTNQYGWLESLVIVSHRRGTNWITHSYSRHRHWDDPPEPPALRELLEVVGERREANEVHHF